jgi:hypothetical protein
MNQIEKKESIEVVELDDKMLDVVTGGADLRMDLDGICPTTNNTVAGCACNMVAGCGG